ncbi:MAG: ATP-binding cassette domain-containing protein [Clostridia bacterium]|nr:ATP-binding cassette domain-containing protein [Clostridia bacterium]
MNSNTFGNTMDKPIVEVHGLKKYFPIKSSFFKKTIGNVKAVDDVSFEIKPGTTLGVVGESGCGKTTMGRTMLRLYPITEGEVLYRGLSLEKLTVAELKKALPKEAASTVGSDKNSLLEYFDQNGIDINRLGRKALNKLRPDIQIIFQDPYSSLSPRLPIGEIIGEAVREHEIVPKEEFDDYISSVMKDCGLQEYHKDRYPHEFSGGQRQRICIARALAMKPKVVVCDEPVSALDVSIQAQIINLLKDLQKERGLTYIFISHDLSVVQHISDEVAVMYLGSMVEKASKDNLFENPMHPYTKALLSAIPVPDPDVKMNRIVLDGDLPSPANPPKGCKFHTRCAQCTERCKNEAPEFKEYEPGHFVACHLYDKQENM